MRLLYVADGRSPIALNWIRYFINQGYEVHLASTFPCDHLDGFASLRTIPVAMSGIAGSAGKGVGGIGRLIRGIIPVELRTRFRQMLAPSSLPRAARGLQAVIEELQPDLMHAMRIPYEGMLATEALMLVKSHNGSGGTYPLLISVWGNDFTLHARSSAALNEHTREALKRADGLHTDCQRDRKLAAVLGFDGSKPSIVLPGGGGVQMDIFYPLDDGQGEEKVSIINPRGFRAYVRNDTFFHAIPMVLKARPEIRFICPGMSGEVQAERWIEELGIGASVELLPQQAREGMAGLFRRSQVMVSITTHDGTPNTLLEGMACGCFPIAGDIESLREWISPGENGVLVDPGDAQALAEAILSSISQPEMRLRAKERNLQLVKERAEYGEVMSQAERFYQRLASRGQA
jgi:glycosyltransferase involved in cell wall biosynthesis